MQYYIFYVFRYIFLDIKYALLFIMSPLLSILINRIETSTADIIAVADQ